MSSAVWGRVEERHDTAGTGLTNHFRELLQCTTQLFQTSIQTPFSTIFETDFIVGYTVTISVSKLLQAVTLMIYWAGRRG